MTDASRSDLNRLEFLGELFRRGWQAGERGPLKVTETVKIQPAIRPAESVPPGQTPEFLPPRYWAAFTLSGAGK